MKVAGLLGALTLTCLLTGCGNESALRDGTFTGTGTGRNGDITVRITVKNGMVSDAGIVTQAETPEFGQRAEEEIFAQFLQNGSTQGIDVVSGATLTSEGLLDALDEALATAHGEEAIAEVYEDAECDIVIIGAGGAGLVAATEAASRGADVIVLEKTGIVGGNTNSSTGGINAAYTAEQKRLGIKDSTDVFYEDTMRGGMYQNDPALVRTLVDNSAAIVEWLQSNIVGADLSDVGIFGGATNKRIHRPLGGGAIGRHLVPLLHKAAVMQGADIRLNNKVIDILSDDGRASGVLVTTESGDYLIHAKAVIIATGGFGANPAMVARYNAALEGFATTNHPGATGDAFALVSKFDAALTQMELIQTHPTVVCRTGLMITEAVRGNGAILVNRAGKRFVDELDTRETVSAAILAEPGGTAFLVFDHGVRNSLQAIETYVQQGLLVEGATPAELAEKTGINAYALAETLVRYNGFVRAKNDLDFHRTPESLERQLKTAPFYAVECEPAIHHTMGGLKIDTKARVLNTKGEPIPALFAAGEVTGGIHGAERLGGNAVADVCIFGKIAADSAADYAGL